MMTNPMNSREVEKAPKKLEEDKLQKLLLVLGLSLKQEQNNANGHRNTIDNTSTFHIADVTIFRLPNKIMSLEIILVYL